MVLLFQYYYQLLPLRIVQERNNRLLRIAKDISQDKEAETELMQQHLAR
jgi:hypothetical protein